MHKDAPSQEDRRGAGSGDQWRVFGVCAFLAMVTLAVFGQTLTYQFINFDDNVYIYENPLVTHGLTLEGVKAAFSAGHSDNWVPLTTLSHMVDCQVFGLNTGDHHLPNVLLQTTAAILLFLVLRQMTGFLWRSAFVAAVFAIHPLRAESVAWVSERKDVLSGVFFMLTLWAYVRFVRSSKSLGWYLMTLFWFILGLLSKPTLITLPFVLLLLDYWPLQRFDTLRLQRLFIEKIPLFLFSFACLIRTLISEKSGIKPLEFYPLPLRIENAIVSYVIQMWRMVCPINLAALYPYPNHIPWWEVALAGMLLAAICALAWAQWRTRPWLLVGWLWYLGMLLPNIGVIQVGTQAQADHHTYLPQIGLYIALTWATADYFFVGRRGRPALLGGAAVVLTALIFCAHRQVTYWRNSELLWTHTLACTSNNFTAHRNLGDALSEKGKLDEAIAQYQKAVQIKPDYAEAYNNVANAMFRKGDEDGAIAQYRKALLINPNYGDAHHNLGSLLLDEGNVDEAIAQYQKVRQLKPDNLEIHCDLGNALFQKGDFTAAIEEYQKALPVELNNADAHDHLGFALFQIGHADEAIVQYQKALQLKPAGPEIENNLAWALATAPQASLRNGIRAVELAQKASGLNGGNNPVILSTLAAAYAEAGRFDDAQRTVKQAIELAKSAGQPDLVEQLTMELKLYQAGLPFHLGNK